MGAIEALRGDGFEPMGDFEVGESVVIGDPTTLGSAGDGSGRNHVAQVRPGVWHLFLRADEESPERVAEIALCHASRLAAFYDAYDEAALAAELDVPSGRVAVVDGPLRDDLGLRKQMLELEELPWLVDRGCVCGAGGPDARYTVFAFGDDYLSIAF